jgi:hypothetical protein
MSVCHSRSFVRGRRRVLGMLAATGAMLLALPWLPRGDKGRYVGLSLREADFYRPTCAPGQQG